MNKKQALAAFFLNNGIDPARAADVNDINCDPVITELSAQVDLWLSGIDAQDHDTFLELLSKYTYLTRAQCRRRYQEILDMLNQRLEDEGITLDETLFITMEAGGASASGGENVRADLRGHDLRRFSKKQLIAAQSKLEEADIRGYRAVVFLDDIVGSGKTMWKAIASFCAGFQTSLSQKRLFLACILPRERGIKHLLKSCRRGRITVEPLYKEEWLQGPAFEKNSAHYQTLSPYEKMIGTYMMCMMRNGKTFFMGFEQNRLLASFYYNTPNNTLCTFWRAVPTNLPPFPRDGDQALSRPDIDKLKMRKKQMQKGAYAAAIDRRNHEDGD